MIPHLLVKINQEVLKMNEVEKIQDYIDRTKIKRPKAYTWSLQELSALYSLAERDPYESFRLAFNYGRAKGYRAAKAEARK